MGFVQAPDSRFDDVFPELTRARLSLPPRANDGERGTVLARIVLAAEASADPARLEDVSHLSDENFIKRMAR